jgi:hypothetical protein
VQILRQCRRKTSNTAPTILSAILYKQQANPLLSMNNYTPLVISGNDKNTQLSLLSRVKLALTARNALFADIKLLARPKELKKWPRPLGLK